MKRSTIILGMMAVVLLTGWYFLHSKEKTELSIPEMSAQFAVDTAVIDSIAFKYATWTYISRHDDRRWYVDYPDWTHPADTAMIREIFGTTNDIVLENLMSTRKDKQDKLGVDRQSGVLLQFFTADVPAAEFVLGKKAPGASHTFIRRLVSDSVFQARGDLTKVFRRVPSDWLSKELYNYDTSDVAEIRWMEEGRETVLSHASEGGWTVSIAGHPETTSPIDTSLLNFKLNYICHLRADAFVSSSSTVEQDMDNPASQLIVRTRDGLADTIQWNEIRKEDVGRTYAFHPNRPKPFYIFFKNTYDRLFSRYDDLIAKDTVDVES